MVAAVSPEPFTSALLTAVVIVLGIRFLDLWEREPLWMVAVMGVWGAAGATAIAAPLNSALESSLSPDIAVVWGPAICAPIVEEAAKGAALVAAFLVSRRIGRRHGVVEFDGPMDGVVYGAAVGIGFAFAENNIHFVQEAYVRGVAEGFRTLEAREGFLNLNTLSHAIYTASFGLGLGLSTWSRTRAARVGFPLLGFAAGTFMHALHNGMISFVLVERFDLEAAASALSGRALPMSVDTQLSATRDAAATALQVTDYGFIAAFAIAVVCWGLYQRKVFAAELAEENRRGLITDEEARLATHYVRRLRSYGRLALAGRSAEARTLRQEHAQLAELAFLKWRLRRTGGDARAITRMRDEIRALRELRQRVA